MRAFGGSLHGGAQMSSCDRNSDAEHFKTGLESLYNRKWAKRRYFPFLTSSMPASAALTCKGAGLCVAALKRQEMLILAVCSFGVLWASGRSQSG